MVSESLLSGESAARGKSSDKENTLHSIFHKRNMLYCGTQMLQGVCEAVVVQIGKDTQMGMIGEEIEKAGEDQKLRKSPLK